MIINTPISLGELLDKISILQIKEKNISDPDKLQLVKIELNLLNKTLEEALPSNQEIKESLDRLVVINSKLWKIEDDIRECEIQKNYNKEFIELARSIYFTNDERSKIKYEINKKFGSKIIEVKSYKEY